MKELECALCFNKYYATPSHEFIVCEKCSQIKMKCLYCDGWGYSIEGPIGQREGCGACLETGIAMEDNERLKYIARIKCKQYIKELNDLPKRRVELLNNIKEIEDIYSDFKDLK